MVNKKFGFEANAIQPLKEWTKKELIQEVEEERNKFKLLSEQYREIENEANSLLDKAKGILGIDNLINRIEKLELLLPEEEGS